ncbi:MAG: LamG domain-containing protein [Nanoarchaeota archaeon]
MIKKRVKISFFTILSLSLLLTAQQCEQPGYCGDGVLNQVIEECDGTDLGEETCESLGFTGGRISCLETCQYDTGGCTIGIDPFVCGDGIINQDIEECDGTDLGGQTCESLGFEAGTLGCTESCFYDTSRCEEATNLIAYWSFDEGTGVITTDVIHGIEGLFSYDGVSWAEECISGSCIEFDSTLGGSVLIGQPPVLDLTKNVIIEAWIKKTSDNDGMIYSKNGPYFLAIRNGALVGGIYSDSSQGNQWDEVYGGTQLQLNTWNKIKLVYDGESMRLYIDGVLDGSEPKTGLMPFTGQDAYVGWGLPGHNQFFTGFIDELKISRLGSCDFYDDFLSGGVDPDKWIEHTESAGFHDEHGSEPLSGIYHVAQINPSSGIHQTKLTALLEFLPGDSFFYDLAYNSASGTIESWPFVSNRYSTYAWVNWNTPPGDYNFAINFLANGIVEFKMRHPDSHITSELITGVTQPYVVTIVSHTNPSALVDFDYSNFKLCPIEEGLTRSKIDPELYKTKPKEPGLPPIENETDY